MPLIKFLLLSSLVVTSANLACGQGQSTRIGGIGDQREAQTGNQQRMQDRAYQRRIESQANQERIQAQANQRATQQAERRMMEGASRAAERAATTAVRRAASAPGGQVPGGHGSPGSNGGVPEGWYPICPDFADGDPTPDRWTSNESEVYPEATRTREPLSKEKWKSWKKRQKGLSGFVKKILGLPKPAENSINTSLAENAPRQIEDPMQAPLSPQEQVRANFGVNANPRAKLANAIRVRQAQVSSLRDLAIETGDPKLIERADQLEQTLHILLANQARLGATLDHAATQPQATVLGDVPRQTGVIPVELASGEMDSAALPSDASQTR